jgi:hypothetical protein
MLICVCLRILASSRIPRYDLGRQNPSFLRWFCHRGPSQLAGNRSSHLHRIVNHVWIFDLCSTGCSKLAEWAVACHELQKIAKIIKGKMQQQSKSMRASAPWQDNHDNETPSGQSPDPSAAFIVTVETTCANQDAVINHPVNRP